MNAEQGTVKKTSEYRLPLILIFVIAILGSFSVFYASQWGPWMFSDGVGYIANTRNFIQGEGLGLVKPSGEFEPLVSHPPLYPLALAITNVFSKDLITAARVFDVLSFGLLILAVGFLLLTILDSLWLAVLGTLLVAVTPNLLLAYTSSMAEPLFLLTAMCSMLLLVLYLKTDSRISLVFSAILCSLSILTRYPGLAFALAGIVSLLLLQKIHFKRRLVHAFSYGMISSFPVLLFLLWTRLVASIGAPKEIANQLDFAPKMVTFAKQFSNVLWSWKPVSAEVFDIGSHALQSSGPTFSSFFLILVLISVGLLALSIRDRKLNRLEASEGALLLLQISLIYLISFILFFLIVYLVSFPTPDVDARTLLPILIFLLLILLAMIELALKQRSAWWIAGTMLGGLIIVFIAGYYVLSFDIATGLNRTGLGYTSREWRGSDTLKAVEDLPEDKVWISNEPMPILLYYDRWPHEMEEISEIEAREINLPFGDGPTTSETLFHEQGGFLILFDSIEEQLKPLYGESVRDRITAITQGLVVEYRGRDGEIFTNPGDQ